MTDFIFVDTLFTDAECNRLVDFFKRHKKYAILRTHKNNQNIHGYELDLDPDQFNIDQQKELSGILSLLHEKLDAFIHKHLVGYFQEDLSHSGYSLREIIGETKQHSDSVFVTYKTKTSVTARVCSIILTLSDTADQLHFPAQNKVIDLKKGSIVCFPPYWMYPHYTTRPQDAQTRYTIQTWLLETTKLHQSDF